MCISRFNPPTATALNTASISIREGLRFCLHVVLAGAMLGLPLRSFACETHTSENWVTDEYQYSMAGWLCTVTRWEGQTEDCYLISGVWDCSVSISETWEDTYCEPVDEPPPPEEDDDDDPCVGESCPDPECDDANHFRVSDGNAKRTISEMRVAGASGLQFVWARHHSTIPSGDQTYFGKSGGWRHSWQFDLVESVQEGHPQLTLIYPRGERRNFRQGAAGGWAAQPWFKEKIAVKGDGFEVTISSGDRLHFTRKTEADGTHRYEMRR